MAAFHAGAKRVTASPVRQRASGSVPECQARAPPADALPASFGERGQRSFPRGLAGGRGIAMRIAMPLVDRPVGGLDRREVANLSADFIEGGEAGNAVANDCADGVDAVLHHGVI